MQRSLTLGIAVAALVCSCGGPYDTGGDGNIAAATPTAPTAPAPTAPAPTAPQVTVVAPDDQHQFEFKSKDDDDEDGGGEAFDVEVRVANASLAAQGKCSGSGPCGHLVLLIDGVACGNPNSTSSKTKFKGEFGRCGTVSGPHQIVVQLVDDRGNVIASSQAVTVSVRVKGHGD